MYMRGRNSDPSYSSPHSSIVTGSLGLLPAATGTFSIFLSTSKESSSITLPNTCVQQ